MQVYIGDKVVLHPVNAGQPLHVSDLTLLDHPECKEVNADPAGTSWKICLFMECREDKNDILKGVSTIDLYSTVEPLYNGQVGSTNSVHCRERLSTLGGSL